MAKKIVYVYTNKPYRPSRNGQRKYIGNTPRVPGGSWATDIGTENCTIYDRPY